MLPSPMNPTFTSLTQTYMVKVPFWIGMQLQTKLKHHPQPQNHLLEKNLTPIGLTEPGRNTKANIIDPQQSTKKQHQS